MISRIGKGIISFYNSIVGVIALFLDILYWIFIGPFKSKPARRESIFHQMVFVGLRSALIVFFVTIFTGIVLAMQSAYQLEQMGATIYVASLVAVSLTRELSPVLVGLVIAGRVGSAITAEIGSMKVSEQIEALDIMAIDPVRFLAVPKFIALFFMQPCLTVLGNISGMLGGYLVGITSLGLRSSLYIQTTFKYLELKDIYTGLSKSFVFGIIIALIGCYQGFNTKGGAEGVGKATTKSVVISFILIILADCVLTTMFYFSNV
ncbi:MAG: ABC transporter permease [Candidatus Omnitrophica bacterium]|nr:ABC transporter permease [Candidatus Omnitrophota bacterium]MCF7894394.1 ABC transporter permease [Candidatus Omnitrophota bacterium]